MRWLRETGVPPSRTVLGGFSQGAVMAYALALAGSMPRPAGMIALSGFIPTVEGLARSTWSRAGGCRSRSHTERSTR